MTRPVRLINGSTWPTRVGALAHFRQMLRKYAVGERVPPGPDHEDLEALLQRSQASQFREQDTRVRQSAVFFSKSLPNDTHGFGSPCFRVHRTDGSSVDFSYIAAVRSIPDTPASDASTACLEAWMLAR